MLRGETEGLVMVGRVFASLLLLSVSITTFSKPALLEHVPLEWRPTSNLKLGATQMATATVTIGSFTDARANKQSIGENAEDPEPRPVTTTDDVGAFVGVHIRQLFDEAGIKTVDGNGAVTIKGEVTKFFVREGNTYQSEVMLQIVVTNTDGKILWKGLASGEATRFGRSYKVENYYEVLSDALVNTVSSMLQAAEFQRALSGHAMGAGT
jgi:Uncharacterized lipoprotein